MPRKTTQEWLIERLHLLNEIKLEEAAGLTRRRLADAKRGKAKLSPEELERIQKALSIFK
jgi:hypothetical protein